MKDLVGYISGKMEVIKFSHFHTRDSGERIPMWVCKCSCGNEHTTSAYNLTRKSNPTKSCGCTRDNYRKLAKKHGFTGSPTYVSWQTMVQRCNNVNSPEYFRYGYNGVSVCSDWLESFENFLEDMGERPEGTTLNRINGAKIYSKENCEWATLSVQSYDQSKSVRNTSGTVGVYWDKNSERWYSRIYKDKVQYDLGFFSEKEKAIQARREAELKLYGFNRE